MAKITGPLLSTTAHGSIGEELTYSHRKKINQVRFQKKQKLVLSTWGQADQKSMYRTICARWYSFTPAEKKVYEDETQEKKLNMSGWNLFLQKALSNPYTYLGLAAYWTFNRTGFGTVLDLSKNGNTGTLQPTWPSNAPEYVTGKNTKLLNALQFDGINDYVNCGDDSSLNITDTVTVAVWLKVAENLEDYTYLFAKGSNGLGDYRVEISLSEKIRFGVRTSNGWEQAQKYDLAPFIGQWVYYVGWWNGSVVKQYVNGAQVTSLGTTGTITTPVTTEFHIGNRIMENYLNGTINDFRIYNRALPEKEILRLYDLFK